MRRYIRTGLGGDLKHRCSYEHVGSTPTIGTSHYLSMCVVYKTNSHGALDTAQLIAL